MVNQHTIKRPIRHCECGDHAWAILTKGYVALISPEDADFIGQWSWSALLLPDGKRRAVRRENSTGKTFYMHREIIEAAEGELVDHRHANGLDNRRPEIRIADTTQNVCNQRPQRRAMSSRFKGVYYDRKRRNYQAYVSHKGVRHRLGRFKSEKAAARAYDAKATELHGDFALTNKSLGLLP